MWHFYAHIGPSQFNQYADSSGLHVSCLLDTRHARHFSENALIFSAMEGWNNYSMISIPVCVWINADNFILSKLAGQTVLDEDLYFVWKYCLEIKLWHKVTLEFYWWDDTTLIEFGSSARLIVFRNAVIVNFYICLKYVYKFLLSV